MSEDVLCSTAMERPQNVPQRSDGAARRPYRARPDDGPRIPVPPRKTLPHEFPAFVDPAKEIFFITICCQKRGANQLATPEVGPALLETVKHRNDKQIWWAQVAMLMPDHVHFLLSFPREKPIQTVVSKWKERTAKTLRIEWQRDFFEHRLRRDEGYREKADYILHNPVRASLGSDGKIGPTCLLGRDIALRCPRRVVGSCGMKRAARNPSASDGAARRPYLPGVFLTRLG